MTFEKNTDPAAVSRLFEDDEEEEQETSEELELLLKSADMLAQEMAPEHVRFAENVLRKKSHVEAWRAARTERHSGERIKEWSAKAYAAKLLKRKDVAEYLRLRRAEIRERTHITVDRIEEEVSYIAFARATDVMKWGEDGVAFIPSDELTQDRAAAVESVKSKRRTRTDENGVEHTTVELELKMYPKLQALQELAKMRGMYQADRKNDADVQRELLATVMFRFVMALHLSRGMAFHEAKTYAEQHPEEVEAWGKEVKLLNA